MKPGVAIVHLRFHSLLRSQSTLGLAKAAACRLNREIMGGMKSSRDYVICTINLCMLIKTLEEDGKCFGKVHSNNCD